MTIRYPVFRHMSMSVLPSQCLSCFYDVCPAITMSVLLSRCLSCHHFSGKYWHDSYVDPAAEVGDHVHCVGDHVRLKSEILCGLCQRSGVSSQGLCEDEELILRFFANKNKSRKQYLELKHCPGCVMIRGRKNVPGQISLQQMPARLRQGQISLPRERDWFGGKQKSLL